MSLHLVTQTAAQARLHAPHRDRRRRIVEALGADGSDALLKRANRLIKCGRFPSVILMSDGSAGLSLDRCRDRMCPLCAGCRGRELTDRFAQAVKRMNAPRFLTLTLASTDDGLAERLDRLGYCFRQLRKTREWRAHVLGGVYTIEVTRSARTGQWHPHIHVIFDGSFWRQADIAALWESVTGDSRIVDVRKVHDADQHAGYIAAYVAKPAELEQWPPDAIAEYALALHGRRIAHTFGSLHGVKLSKPTDDDAAEPAEPGVSAAKIVRAARRGSAAARRVIRLAGSLGPLWRRALCVPPEWCVATTADRDETLRELARLVPSVVEPAAPAGGSEPDPWPRAEQLALMSVDPPPDDPWRR